MVMGILVSGDGDVCIAHDMDYEGRPVCMNYNPARRTMTMMYDNGGQAQVLSGTMPEICERLRRTRSVLLKQMQAGAPVETLVPLYVLFDDTKALHAS